MRLSLRVLAPLLAALLLAAVAVPPVAADPLVGIVERPIFYGSDGSQPVPNPGNSPFPEHRVYRNIADYLESMLVANSQSLFQRYPEFKCVRTQTSPGDGFPRVRILPRITAMTPDDPPLSWLLVINVFVHVGGNSPPISRDYPGTPILVTTASYGPDEELKWEGEALFVEAVRQLREIIDELVMRNRVNLCEPKAKVRGKHTIDQVGGGARVFLENRWEGEGPISLNEDGSFDATIPLTYQQLFTAQGAGYGCTGEQSGQDQLNLTGAHRQANSSLAFDRVGGFGQARGVAECTAPPPVGRISMPIGSGGAGDLASGQGLSIELKDGAQLSIPPPPGVGGDWEWTIELSYGDQTAVSSPADQAKQALADDWPSLAYRW